MKTRELIAALQEADPSGELDCVVENAPISGVYAIPAYYDGPYERIHFSEAGPAVGGDFVQEGRKVELSIFGIEDLLLDDPEAPVGFIGFTPEQQERQQRKLDDLREQNREVVRRVKAREGK